MLQKALTNAFRVIFFLFVADKFENTLCGITHRE
jgi:hypothetical protein